MRGGFLLYHFHNHVYLSEHGEYNKYIFDVCTFFQDTIGKDLALSSLFSLSFLSPPFSMTKMKTDARAPEEASGFNQTKRHWARVFLWATSILLLFDKPLLSLATSSCAVYIMHGGKWLSQKNMKWMGASIISFCVSLYALALCVESDFVDEDRAYELKATLSIKHRIVEIIWGGLLFLCLVITVKEHVDKAIDRTSVVVNDLSNAVTKGNDQKKQL